MIACPKLLAASESKKKEAANLRKNSKKKNDVKQRGKKLKFKHIAQEGKPIATALRPDEMYFRL